MLGSGSEQRLGFTGVCRVVLWILQEEKGMRTVIDAVTPAIKEGVKIGTQEAVKYLTEKGIRKTVEAVEAAVYKIPVAKRFARRGVVRVTPVVRRATIATRETTRGTARTLAITTRDAAQTTTQAANKVAKTTTGAVGKAAQTTTQTASKAAKTTTEKVGKAKQSTTQAVGKVLPRRKSAEDTADPGTTPQD